MYKILFIMRVIALLFFAAIMQVSASTHAQKLTYVQKNASLEQLFKEIKKQTGYNIVWYEGKLNPEWSVNANFRKTPLKDVMNIALTGMQLDFTISNKTVVIKEKEMSLMDKLNAAFSNIVVHGRVVDETGSALQGASVKVKNTNKVTITDVDGHFTLNGVPEKAMLVISYLGFETKEVEASEKIGTLQLVSGAGKLNEVEVVSTGYQDIPKERATGSFTVVDNKTINRSVGINILDRLEGVTSGLLFNRGLLGTNNSKISIRGRSTIFANPTPTIVLDGFPYEGTIDQINPADISTITILKDAAAASIWGAKASNGVIVITTKKGEKNQKLSIEASSTLTLSNKPNLYYNPQISSSDFIDLEQFLFNKGFYSGTINRIYSPISEAVEIFNQRKSGNITSSDSTEKINNLKTRDVRDDLNRYLYRPSVYQQYQLNFRGGSNNYRYYISGGYDKNLENIVSNSFNRLTVKSSNTFSLFKDKLQLLSDINYISSNSQTVQESYIPYSPYDRLVDDEGNSLPTVKNLRLAYATNAGNGKLLDWLFRPKDELKNNVSTRLDQIRLKLGINYKILNGLSLDANYQYLKENNKRVADNDLGSYYTRNLINTFSSITGNTINRGIPLGNILNTRDADLISKIIRIQLNLNKVIATNHEINAIAGYEGGDAKNDFYNQILYGYFPDTKINGNNLINPLNRYSYYYDPGSGQQIPTAPNLFENNSITQSYYANASYSYKKKYTITGSARRDESNLFGVKANQKGVPLWSVGIAWAINKENFLDIGLFSVLKLRATLGYNGNVDKTVSGYLTSRNLGMINEWGSNYSTISNPPNPSLRWEKVQNWNIGIDFTTTNDRFSGSIDIYQKNAADLIGNNPIALQSGITQFKGNGANLKTKGIDFVLNSNNIIGDFNWRTSLLFNYNTDKVTKYGIKQGSNFDIVNGNFNNPLEGYPYYAIFSFPSAGLDETGAPRGYFNGSVSKDYTAITSALNPNLIKYHGSASPKYFGSLINTFNYKNLELSLNLLFKFDYYFRRVNIFSGSNNYSYITSSDFDKRWKKPGDELITKIPALIYPNNPQMSTFFQNSEDLVENGSHLRLQDIRLSYKIANLGFHNFSIKGLNVFLYTKNLGIIWRMNKLNIDPDYGNSSIPQPFSASLGVNFNL
ncbi:SusC/RagA family TonB-linked outer membrane protein [Pedobacter sp. MC2016-24]|uniref:SusC/RagA family TonB-linked outer membrane protein n=1 Tax=Pedobacter sp. MC2016-24 TaxID=2780090 RepID=UPI001880EE29|nr:SusC/RagA family TonB-linked outer membrane protein [Pedobacter sp. MC2016-24]MBE9600174.1 SusC/RagA family TonB-linked outer membrane protein [Pedobacter sp. MC2016-24]